MMTKKRRMGLGRGLDVLLGPDLSTNVSDASDFRRIQIDALIPGKYQPRQSMAPEALNALADSIRSQGLLQPIVVRPLPRNHYEILAGERRWRAAQIAGLKEVPIIIHDIGDDQALMIALIENIQREDLNAIEEAQGIARLIEEFGLTHQEAAEQLGRSRSSISNLLRLLSLSQPIKEMLLNNQLEMGHARCLLSLPVESQLAMAKRIEKEGLSVREVESLVQQKLSDKPSVKKATSSSPDIERLKTRLSDWLGTQTNVTANAKGKGKLSISFSTLDQLDNLLNRLGLPEEDN